MSPAKRLSRQRFRALCERCRAYGSPGPMDRRDELRAVRFAWAMRRRDPSKRGYFAPIEALARLAR